MSKWILVMFALGPCAACAAPQPASAPAQEASAPEAVASLHPVGAASEQRLFLRHAQAAEIASVLDELLAAPRRSFLARFEAGSWGCALPWPGREDELFSSARGVLSEPGTLRADPQQNALVLTGFEERELVHLRELVTHLDDDAGRRH